MKNNTKYIFACLKERNGEYEYYHNSIHELPDKRVTTANLFLKNYAKDFYGGEPEKSDGGYYFHGGEVFVEVDSWKFISEEDYHILKLYL